MNELWFWSPILAIGSAAVASVLLRGHIRKPPTTTTAPRHSPLGAGSALVFSRAPKKKTMSASAMMIAMTSQEVR